MIAPPPPDTVFPARSELDGRARGVSRHRAESAFAIRDESGPSFGYDGRLSLEDGMVAKEGESGRRRSASRSASHLT